jgi:iron complex transport system ATP-binding protein
VDGGAPPQELLVTISVQGLHVAFGKKSVLHHVNIHAGSGRVLGIIGPNGCGKSTLIKAIAGLLPAQGQIRFHGATQRPRAIGYMPQDSQALAALTVLEVVLLGRIAQLHLKVHDNDLDAVSQTLVSLGIGALAPVRISDISGGQRQLVYLAQALVAQPRYLLLDEPTSALDVSHQLEVLAFVRGITHAQGLTTVMVLHDLNAAARYCDDIALMSEGRVVRCDAAAHVLGRETVSEVFDVVTESLRCSDGIEVLVAIRKKADVL